MDFNTGLVSVIMSVRNSDTFLPIAVQSVLQQSYRNIEFLIYDDGSTDDTYSILRWYQSQDDRIKVFSGKHLGLPAALNYLISISRGQFIARMDADDVSLPSRLSQQAHFLSTNSLVDLCGTQIELIDCLGRSLGSKMLPLHHHDILKVVDFQSPIYHPSFMFRSELVRDSREPFYNPFYYYAQDYELLLFLILSGRIVANLPNTLLQYRVSYHKLDPLKILRQARFTRLALSSKSLPPLNTKSARTDCLDPDSLMNVTLRHRISARFLIFSSSPRLASVKFVKYLILALASCLSSDIRFLVFRDVKGYNLPRLILLLRCPFSVLSLKK